MASMTLGSDSCAQDVSTRFFQGTLEKSWDAAAPPAPSGLGPARATLNHSEAFFAGGNSKMPKGQRAEGLGYVESKSLQKGRQHVRPWQHPHGDSSWIGPAWRCHELIAKHMHQHIQGARLLRQVLQVWDRGLMTLQTRQNIQKHMASPGNQKVNSESKVQRKATLSFSLYWGGGGIRKGPYFVYCISLPTYRPQDQRQIEVTCRMSLWLRRASDVLLALHFPRTCEGPFTCQPAAGPESMYLTWTGSLRLTLRCCG